MSQRVKRGSRKMAQNIDQISIGNSAHPARQNVDRSPAEVVIPPKTTGDADNLKRRLDGLAKASPLFKEVTPTKIEDPEEEKKTIAENTVEASDQEDEDAFPSRHGR